MRERVLATVLAVAGLLAVSGTAHAQSADDFPQYKGSPARTGSNGSPVTAGSGDTTLRWYLQGSGTAIVADNYPYGSVTGAGTVTNSRLGTWTSPDVTQEAKNPYLIRDPSNVGVIYRPAYLWTATTPSAVGTDPTIAATPADRRYFDWTFNPLLGTHDYTVSVWLPSGPTIKPDTKQVYPQSNFVYEVQLGGIPILVDVVDSAQGGGWVRLGNGSTPLVVHTDGSVPITVRLYNTVPRDTAGNLIIPTNTNATDYAVYADAAEITPSVQTGSYTAGPVVSTFTQRSGTVNTRVLTVRNNISQATIAGTSTEIQQGIATSYLFNGASNPTQYNQTTAFWSFSPISTSSSTTAVDNTSATTTGAAFTSSTLTGRYTGADYEVATALVPAATTDPPPTPTADVRYAPTLADGDYEAWAYLSGDVSPTTFARFAQYEIHEGATITTVTVDQSQTGWVQIGTRRFANTTAAPLEVRVTNSSSSPTDSGKNIFADAVRFVGASDLSVTSTPVQAVVRIKKSDGTVADTPVDVIADERGVIHCLDAEGNADGTTTEYWSYPSTPDRGDSNWVDPNVKEGIDGVYKSGSSAASQVITAVMPDGFDNSSALVQRVNGEDYLYIAARNGRVYCIAMQGRGDYNKTQTGSTTILPGTTRRVWTYPNDPKDDPKTGVASSSLGAFVGSVVYGLSNSNPTIFVPAAQGRLYALDAAASTTTPRTTTVRWAYPALDQPTLGSIVSTPSYDFNRLYFGTLRKDDASNGQFLAVNADDGTVAWSATSLTWDLASTSNPTNKVTTTTDFSDFRCSPITVHGSVIGDTTDYVYLLNDNGYLYGLSAADGSVVGAPYTPWVTNTNTMTSRTTLGFTYLSAPVQGTTSVVPVVTVTTVNGRFLGFLAKATQTTTNGLPVNATDPPVTPTRYVISRTAKSGEALTPAAMGDGWLYFGDNGGTFYAFSLSGGGGSSIDPNDGDVPVDSTAGDEDPNNILYNKAKIKLITRDAFRQLQGLTSQTALDYKGATSTASALNRSPNAFDWGETVYMLVYDFPYPTTSVIPSFNVNLTVDGQTTRSVPANTMQFPTVGTKNPPKYSEASPATTATENDPLLNGYAIAQFTFQSAGQNALPPGTGRFEVTVNNVGTTTSTATQIDLPTTTSINFYVANPLGLEVGTTAAEQIGTSLLPSDPENLVNGSPNIGSASKSLLSASTGKVTHGNVGSTVIKVIDRSLMTLLRPGQVGIDNLRMQVRDVTWQGGEGAIFKPFDDTLYPGFEDKPNGYPNTSKDYPDIPRDQIKVTKDPTGTPENPVGFNTSLFPPYVGTLANQQSVTEDNYASRVLSPTPFQIDVTVPKYQPPNTVERLKVVGSAQKDSTGSYPEQGYVARLSVFVDSVQNGVLDSVTAKEAFRAFNLYASVAPDEHLSVVTPNVDLGSLAGGTGYSPLWPAASGPFDPWSGAWQGEYKSFTVRNEGNVNLFDVRLATRENVSTSGGTYVPFGFVSSTSDSLAWLDTSTDLYSDLDAPFAPVNPNYTGGTSPEQTAVIVPKPRPDDRVGTDLSVNPVRRANPNLGTTGTKTDGTVDSLLDSTLYPVGPPRVGVSVPIGFPAGHYSQNLAVVENFRTSTNTFDLNDPAWTLYPEGPTPYADPSVTVSFNVRETRATTTSTPRTAPILDDFSTTATTQAFPYANMQPAAVRDSTGGLLFAWTSNRPALNPTPQIPTTANTGDAWRIYFGGIGNSTTFSNSGYTTTAGQTPLRDLNQFSPDSTNGRWMHPLGSKSGFPDGSINSLQQLFGQSVVADTGRFGSPSFPVSGVVNPYLSSSNSARLMTSTYLAFVGDAQTNSASGRGTTSRVFLTPVSTSGNGNMSLGTPLTVPGDPASTKGKPSVVIAADTSGKPTGAVVFYNAASSGTSGLYYSYYNANTRTFGAETPLNVGTAFESVSGPSGAARAYIGDNTQYYGNRIIDLSFSGKLRNRPSTEVYMGRLLVDDNGAPIATNPFAYLPPQTTETLVSAGGSTFRARGVGWNREYPMQLLQVVNGTPVSILMDGFDTSGTYNPTATNPDTKAFDRTSGMIVYSTRLGGKVYLDPNVGTVRFSSVTLASGATLMLSYQPRFLRLSNEVVGSVVAYSNPNALYDQRYISDPSFWRTSGNVQAQAGATFTNDRYVLTYGRSAADGTQSARPLISTLRFGIKLPSPIATSNGVVTAMSVTGSSGYQIDPSNQAVYFTAADEDRTISVSYTGIDPATESTFSVQWTGTVSLIPEIAPYEVPIEQAFNEANLTSFLDPFTYSAAAMRRPPLIWMFWSSTRAGNPDVFFQTIAPQWNPVIVTANQ